jgi:hypothetical protein
MKKKDFTKSKGGVPCSWVVCTCWLVGLLFTATLVCGQEHNPNANNEQSVTADLFGSALDLTLAMPQQDSSVSLRELVIPAMHLSFYQEVELRHLRIDMAEDLQWLYDQSTRRALTNQGALLRYRAVVEKYRALRDSVLTDDQLNLMERAQEHMARRPKKPFIGARFPLIQVLDLNKNQQTQGHRLLERHRQKLLALKKSNAKLGAADHTYAMEEMRLAFEEILTPHQTEKLSAVRTAWQEQRQHQAELKYIIEAAEGVVDTSAAQFKTPVD